MKLETKAAIASMVRKLAGKEVTTKAVVGVSEGGVGSGAELVAGTEFASEICEGLKSQSIFMANAQVYDVSDRNGNQFTQPYFTTSLEDEPTAGTRSYWISEGATKTACVPGTDGINLKLGKIACRVVCTDEILEDQERLINWLVTEATSSLARKIDKAGFMGTSDKALKGVMAAGDSATLVVSTSADVTVAEASGYVDVLHPNATKAKFFIDKTQEVPLLYSAYTQPQALHFEGGKTFLFNRELVVSSALQDTPYHICLADLSKYVIVHKGIKIRRDPDTYFLTDQTVLLVEFRIAGSMATTTALADNGETYGWVVCPDGGEAANSSSSSESSSVSSPSTVSSASSVSSQSVSSASSLTSVSSVSSASSVSSVSSLSTGPAVVEINPTGDPDPSYSCLGTYAVAGTYGGQTSYRSMESTYHLWFDSAAQKWFVTDEIGFLGVAYWYSSNATMAGAYTAGGLASEGVTVASL